MERWSSLSLGEADGHPPHLEEEGPRLYLNEVATRLNWMRRWSSPHFGGGAHSLHLERGGAPLLNEVTNSFPWMRRQSSPHFRGGGHPLHLDRGGGRLRRLDEAVAIPSLWMRWPAPSLGEVCGHPLYLNEVGKPPTWRWKRPPHYFGGGGHPLQLGCLDSGNDSAVCNGKAIMMIQNTRDINARIVMAVRPSPHFGGDDHSL